MDLLGRVREDFGIPLIGVRPTGLGADARAVLFRGETADGRAYAVKASTAPQPGLVVADFLATRGVPGVPAPLRTRSGTVVAVAVDVTGDRDRNGDSDSDSGDSGDWDGSSVSVVPWVEGARAIETGLDAAQWRTFGEVLGAVHSTPPAAPLVGAEDGLLPLDRHDPTAEVRRARRFGAALLRARAQRPVDPLLGELADLWDRHGSRVLEVAALAGATATDEQVWRDVDRVICHTDPHHGNLLLGSTTAPTTGSDAGPLTTDAGPPATDAGPGEVWLVDWDDAVLAPREADLIFVVGGVYSFAPITDAQVGWFFEGYTPASGGVTLPDLDPTRLTYYRSTRALTDFLDFADAVLADDAVELAREPDLRPEPADRAAALRIAAGALSPDGLVTITLSKAAAGH